MEAAAGLMPGTACRPVDSDMKKTICPFLLVVCCFSGGLAQAASVTILHDHDMLQAAYAVRKLGAALFEQGYALASQHTGYDYRISLVVRPGRLKAEAFSIIPEGKVITVNGGDRRSMIYGALTLAEVVRNGTPLAEFRATEQKPNLEFRGIKFNLPWHTYRPSSALDQHYETVRDLRFWEAFLDMMVDNRFNVISLWNLDPYAFRIRSKNFPEASPWSDKEMAQWQRLYHGIFRLAKERALDTYIVHWNIFVSRAFAEARYVAKQNFYPHYFVPGDTSEIVRRYLRECVKQTLEEHADLDGIGVSHGEGMAGMTPLERQQWVDDVLIAGMLEAHRPVKLIHRVPFSSGTSSYPGVSKIGDR